MLRRNLQTFVWKYDKHFASAVAVIPAALQSYSSKLGRITLPSIWAGFLSGLGILLLLNGHTQLALLGFITIACIPIATLMKLLFRRSRPKTIYAQNMKIKSYSFPSSHAYSAMIAGGYVTLVAMVLLPMPLSLIISTIIAILVVMIGVSRIHVGAHYPTDVTAAWILGGGVLYCIMQITI